MGYVYCLYSTEDGEPRYVGHTGEKVSHRFKQHVTAALEKETGVLYDWVRDVWRRDHDVNFYILQEGIVPKDLDFFERYWIEQFTGLLNIVGNDKPGKIDSNIARQVRTVLREQIQLAKNKKT